MRPRGKHGPNYFLLPGFRAQTSLPYTVYGWDGFVVPDVVC